MAQPKANKFRANFEARPAAMLQPLKCGPAKGQLTCLELESATGGDALNLKVWPSQRLMNLLET